MMRSALIMCVLTCSLGTVFAQPITYQGQLQRNGALFSDTVTMEFRLYDALTGGTQIGPMVPRPTQSVVDGLFQVELDFGSAAFDGTQRYLEVTVGGTVLSPRQAITAAPVAVYALGGNQGPQGDPGPTGPQGVQGPQGPAGADLPAGTLLMYAGTTAPEGYLIADGREVLRSTYFNLFSVISTTYGAGNNSTTFNLPDLRQRFPLGANGTLGTIGGNSTATLSIAEMPAHTHSVSDPGHNHSVSLGLAAEVISGTGVQSAVVGSSITASSLTGITINSTGGGQAFSIMNPYLAVNYIIKY